MDAPGACSAAPILLVEDDEGEVQLTLRAFKRAGFANPISVVHDGEQALDYLFQRGDFADPAAAPRPTLVLLDLKMPRLDGLEVLRELKRAPVKRRIPVVVLTSSRHETDLAAAYDLGANAYVVKPVEFEQFVQAVQQIGLFWIATVEPPPLG